MKKKPIWKYWINTKNSCHYNNYSTMTLKLLKSLKKLYNRLQKQELQLFFFYPKDSIPWQIHFFEAGPYDNGKKAQAHLFPVTERNWDSNPLPVATQTSNFSSYFLRQNFNLQSLEHKSYKNIRAVTSYRQTTELNCYMIFSQLNRWDRQRKTIYNEELSWYSNNFYIQNAMTVHRK